MFTFDQSRRRQYSESISKIHNLHLEKKFTGSDFAPKLDDLTSTIISSEKKTLELCKNWRDGITYTKSQTKWNEKMLPQILPYYILYCIYVPDLKYHVGCQNLETNVTVLKVRNCKNCLGFFSLEFMQCKHFFVAELNFSYSFAYFLVNH